MPCMPYGICGCVGGQGLSWTETLVDETSNTLQYRILPSLLLAGCLLSPSRAMSEMKKAAPLCSMNIHAIDKLLNKSRKADDEEHVNVNE